MAKISERSAKKPDFDTEWAKKVRVPPLVVVVFTRQLASMLATAVPIVQALDTLSHQSENPAFGEVVRICGQRLETGISFSHCVSLFPRVFPSIYKTMVQIGETTGSLDSSLDKLATWLERDQTIRHRVKSALSYPMFIMVLATGLTLAIFYSIMPTFASIFQDMNISLPLLTRLVMGFTKVLRDPPTMLIVVAVLVAAGSWFRHFYRTPSGYRQSFALLIKIPVAGDMVRFAALTRYCSSLEVLLGCGMDINTSLRLAAGASGSPLLEQDAPYLIASVSEGNPVAYHMAHHPEIYPMTLRSMIGSGEEVSRVPEMCSRIATFYEMELSFRIDALSATLEPVMLAGVALVVATIVLSIFLPLYSNLAQLGA